MIRKAASGVLIAGLGLAVMFSSTAWAQKADAYQIKQTWKLGGEGGWDYLLVDSQAHLLYIARNNRVMVVDLVAGKEKAEITGLGGTHGVALNPDGKTGYISDGAAGMIRVFDRSTFQVTASVQAGTNPDSILYEPTTRSVYAFNGRSKNATVMDTATNRVVATIPLPGKPEFSQADGQGHVFVNIEDTSQLVRIDAANHKVLNVWPLAPCESPSGLAIDAAHHRLFSVCDNKTMAIVDSDTGKLVATQPIGDGPDADRFDTKDQLAFSSNGEGSLTVVKEDSPDKFHVVQTLPTKRGARTMAIDSRTGTIYLVTAEFGPKPAATAEHPRPRPAILADSFEVLVVER
ncbi:YncE family protein [Paracidobacterium acidisoli]|uniref:YncE family protein n=1 Tax=Paracidobacterium acidisoli TaxID=2303751 RepID=A0A372IM40_9BACT|nr:YncE family protein [Paracidobacterium acidisoli]MBT9332295.1 YncE family protein [Paracidobacterium acidisoli]